MLIGIPKEIASGENRIACSPEIVKKLVKDGHKVFVESGAGVSSCFSDDDFSSSGATILATAKEVFEGAELIMKVQAPTDAELDMLESGKILIGLLRPYDENLTKRLNQNGVVGFAMEKLPRISRAQSMDVLSSQANLAGYKAVLLAANAYNKLMPMLMTAAGTVKAARVVVMGVGVAGLQAIATAKRLGAVVEATDVRPETKEQVESLGAKFIEVPLTEEEKELAKGEGGYAKEMGDDYKRRQAELIAERLKQADMVITTALIPGRPAPVLVTEEMVKAMKPGSVIVDMAVEQGGNCPLTKLNEITEVHGVTLIGVANIPSTVATDASALYARNLYNFLALVVNKDTGKFDLNLEDEVVSGTLLTSHPKTVNSGAS
ncbi:MAG: Re/Si-specific NAD(P)(+) transhydrogenase subunit alpha [Betaproteobacteria bacterium]